MRQINFGMTLSLLLVTTLLSGCASFWKPEKEIVTVTKLIERNIPTVPSPKPVQMNDVKIYVVSPSENFEEFKKEFEAKNGADSYIGQLVSTMNGSTETTFYVLAVYFGSVGISRYRHAVWSGLSADIVGVFASILAVNLLL